MKKRLILLSVIFLSIGIGCFVIIKQKGGLWSSDPIHEFSKEKRKNPYVNDTLQFSLDMPEEFKMTTLEGADDGTTTLLAQGKDSQYQIYIMPFDEVITLTADRIRAEIPDMVIKNDKQVKIEGSEQKALVFESADESFGPTYEAWFIHAGNLYQLKSKLDASKLIDSALSTWKFE